MENDSRSHKKLELLAPAGSYEGILAAYRAGADAVYTGGSLFSARAYAQNCSMEELISAIHVAHLLDKKLYLTVNTLLKESELKDDLKSYLDPLADAGLDAVIVQDLGVLKYLKREYPDLELHASTQMTIASPDGAALIEPYITRVVTPRELSLSEIRRIYDRTHLEIECFVHGALCYCYSGRCLMSSVYGGRSGNRGRCAQPCRLDYDLLDLNGNQLNRKNENLLISPKDLCGIDRIPDMVQAGVCSFKIEGRMKKPEYTAGVVSVYRKYLDLYEEWDALGRRGELAHFHASREDRERLMLLFSRNGFTEGYFERQNGREMLMVRPKEEHGDNQDLLNELKKKYVDPGAPKRGVSMDPVTVKEGEPIRITLRSGETSVSLTSESRVSMAQKRPMLPEDFADKLSRFGNSPFELSSPIEVRSLSENVFFPVSELNSLRQRAVASLEQKLLQERAGSPAVRDITEDEAKHASEIPVAGSDRTSPEFSVSGADRPYHETPSAEADLRFLDADAQLSVLVSTEEQLQTILAHSEGLGKLRIILSAAGEFYPADHPAAFGAEKWNRGRAETDGTDRNTKLRAFSDQCRKAGHKLLLEFPEIFRYRAELYFDRHPELLRADLFDGFLLHSADELGYVRRMEVTKGRILAGDSSLYVMNSEALDAYRELGLSSITLSEELSGKEMRYLLRSVGNERLDGCHPELQIYGRRPVMISAQCLENTVRGCALKADRKAEDLILADRKGAHLPVRRNCLFCYNIIYNSKIHSLLGEDLSEFFRRGTGFRVSFLFEDAAEVKRILDLIRSKIRLEWNRDPSFTELGNEYTRGHYRDSVL